MRLEQSDCPNRQVIACQILPRKKTNRLPTVTSLKAAKRRDPDVDIRTHHRVETTALSGFAPLSWPGNVLAIALNASEKLASSLTTSSRGRAVPVC